MMWGWDGNLGYGWMGFLGPVFMILFWGLIILGIVALVQRTTGQGSEPRGNSALRILEERYAKGEISKEEFEEKKKDLQK